MRKKATTGKSKKTKAAPKAAVSKPKKVPLVRAYLAVSMDGYIADSKGGVDWLTPYFSPEIDFGKFMSEIGATIMGRRTFEFVHGSSAGGGSASGAPTNLVLTRRPLPKNARGSFAVKSKLPEAVAKLKELLSRKGKDIWLMGGGNCIDAFDALGLIDRFEISIIPVTLGDGISLFPKNKRPGRDLTLTHSKVLSNGVVNLQLVPTKKA